MKITNNDLIKELELNNSTFYAMKKNKPRCVELLKKGLWAERNVKAQTLLNGIKQDNKKGKKNEKK